MTYNIKNLELVNFLKEDESYITGEEMLKRAPDYKALGDKKFSEWLKKNRYRFMSCFTRLFKATILLHFRPTWNLAAQIKNLIC